MIALVAVAVVAFGLGFATAAIIAARRHMAELMEVVQEAGEKGYRVGVRVGQQTELHRRAWASDPGSGETPDLGAE